MSILMNKDIEKTILPMKQKIYLKFWEVWADIQEEKATGKPKQKIYQFELDALEKVKKRYGRNRV